MKLLNRVKNFIYKFDFFCTTELLRYKSEPVYRTLFGGMLSMFIIIGLIAVFYNKFMDCINKVSISSN